ncbi:MAG: LamG domain-containing protein [Clostridiales bacterium]|nr:LamG domain-containing protein [Clostridiales bacterium]
MSNYYLNFTGSETITVPDDVSEPFTNSSSWSISLWVKTTDTTSFNFLLYYFDADEWYHKDGWGIRQDDSNLILHLGREGITQLDISTSSCGVDINDGEWHHVVFVIMFMGPGADATPYVDTKVGTPQPCSTHSQTGYFNEVLRIGHGYDTGIPTYYFNGSLDDIRLYFNSKILFPSDISDIYNDGIGTKLTGSEYGLTWGSNCDTGTGTTLYDITETTNGTLSTADIWEEGGVPLHKNTILLNPNMEITVSGDKEVIHFASDNSSDEAVVKIHGDSYIVRNSAGKLVFDFNGENEYTFQDIKDLSYFKYSSNVIGVIFDSFGSFIFSIFTVNDIDGSTITYYKAFCGDSDLELNKWYLNYNKKHAFKIYSDFDAII